MTIRCITWIKIWFPPHLFFMMPFSANPVQERDTMIVKSGSAEWRGTLRDGTGQLSTESGALTAAPYSFATRFDGKHGTNPEELIGAAHAACFSMAFANMLSEAGIGGVTVTTTAKVSMDKRPGGMEVVSSALTTHVKADGDAARVREIAEAAKAGCPISKLLRADITLDLTVG
jgi:osmotically inducible protein OsmC